MRDSQVTARVAAERADQRALAIRELLARPLLDAVRDRDAFTAVARDRGWLAKWFEDVCGWTLTVDIRGGWARLAKRTDHVDPTRPARRLRGSRQPFDRRRYQLMCLVCAELTRVSMTTIGILASALASASAADEQLPRFDSAKRSERMAFVDALKWLADLGVVSFGGGEVELYVASERGNAIVEVDGARLHRLIASARPPSSIDCAIVSDAVRGLCEEPRYGSVPSDPDSADDEARNRWLRHSVARRLIDDPVLYRDQLQPAQQAYLNHPAGRRWLLGRAGEAGFVVEERAEGMLLVDRDRIATDIAFPGPNDNVKQAALLLIERFACSEGGNRRLLDLDMQDVVLYARELLSAHSRWAKQYRDDAGPARLADAAVELLERFGLVVRDGDTVRARPAIARYRAEIAEARTDNVDSKGQR